MRRAAVWAIFRKEIKELCRDKKTLFIMFAMPLLIYPLLIVGIATVMLGVTNRMESDSYTIVLEQVETDLSDRLLQELEDVDYSFEAAAPANPSEALEEREIDAILRADGTEYTVEYNSASTRSNHAADYLCDQLEAYAQDLSTAKIEEAGLDVREYLEPISIKTEDKASDEKALGSILGGIVPLLLIMGVFLGAMTPAVDVTAGEKERGTQETLMTFPISGHELICGKYLAVAASGALSAILYMLTIGLIGLYIFKMTEIMGAVIELTLSTFIPSLTLLFVTFLAFSLFLSAAMMCVATFAKSEKEASSYLSPIMVVVMLVAYIGYLDVHLTLSLAIVPVLNIVLLVKSVMVFEYDIAAIILVLVSNLTYAAIAITVLGNLYTSERILFGEHENSLLERRSSRVPGAVPTIGDSVLTLLVVLLLYLYIGGLLQVKYLLPGVGLTQLIIAAVPLFAAWYGRIDVQKTFQLKTPGIKTMGATVILALGAYILCSVLCQPVAHLADDSAESFTQAMDLLMDGQRFVTTLLVIAVAPAICEETLFRGYLLSSLLEKTKPRAAIAVSALLFGVFHMNLYQGCYAFLLGLFLAFSVYRSGSIVCSCLIHFICNTISVLLAYFPDKIGAALPVLTSDSPAAAAGVFAVGAGLTALGLFLLIRVTDPEQKTAHTA